MELMIAVIIFVALLVAWFVLPGSKTSASEPKTESVGMPSIQQQV